MFIGLIERPEKINEQKYTVELDANLGRDDQDVEI